MASNKATKKGNIYGFNGGNFAGNIYETNGCSPGLLTFPGGGVPLVEEEQTNKLVDKGTYLQLEGKGVYEKENRFYKAEASAPTVNTCSGGNRQPKVVIGGGY